MMVSKIRIKKLIPNKGHIGFVSCVIDDWLFIGNIAIFSRLNDPENIRLVFPEKKIGEKKISIFYPLTKEAYLLLENTILEAFKKL